MQAPGSVRSGPLGGLVREVEPEVMTSSALRWARGCEPGSGCGVLRCGMLFWSCGTIGETAR